MGRYCWKLGLVALFIVCLVGIIQITTQDRSVVTIQHHIAAMPIPLSGHTATLLVDGRVLLIGGTNSGPKPPQRTYTDWFHQCYDALFVPIPVFSAVYVPPQQLACELFNPETNGWTRTEDMKVTDDYYPETINLPMTSVLKDGSILTVGTGQPRLLFSNYFQGFAPLKDCEIFDPTSKKWSMTGQFKPAESGIATALLNTGEVLEIGGYYGGGHNLNYSGPENFAPGDPQYRYAPRLLNDCHLYEPGSKTWVSTGNLCTPRNSTKAVVLQNGSVLVIGGASPVDKTCELYDVASRTWRPTGSTVELRDGAVFAVLPDGSVLAAGGGTASCEIYDPKSGVWKESTGMLEARAGHVAVTLANGRVLVIGGDRNHCTCEVYDPGPSTWTATGSLQIGRTAFTATCLKNGKVLVTGGADPDSYSLDSCELYDPTKGSWSL